MIEIRNLSKNFGTLRAVDGVSFSVQRGEVLGFLGPNGAGKSTTMKMLTGFLDPTGGEAVVCGHDVATEPLEAKKCIGYLPEGAPLYPDMTARSFLEFIAEIRGLDKATTKARMEAVIHQVHLEGVLNQRLETLSKGFKRRVGLAQAILHDPKVLVLDEPTDGLDPNQKHEVRSLIQAMSEDKVIILSTHILEEVDAVCSRAIIIAKGKLLFDGTPEELRGRSPHHNAVSLRFQGSPPANAREALTALSGVAGIEGTDERLLVIPSNGSPIVGEISRCAQEQGWSLGELVVEQGQMDEVFRLVTAGRD